MQIDFVRGGRPEFLVADGEQFLSQAHRLLLRDGRGHFGQHRRVWLAEDAERGRVALAEKPGAHVALVVHGIHSRICLIVVIFGLLARQTSWAGESDLLMAVKNMESGLPDWEVIVRTHAPMAFDTAWRLLGHAADTEDAVQEALLDAFQLHGRQPVSNWGGLLRHLATRRAIDRLRKQRRAVPLALKPLIVEPASPESEQPESAAIERELAERLRLAVAELPDREGSVFSLRYFGEMANSDIAETLGISTDAVGVALHKARKRLKETLGLQEVTPRRSR
jgi:RNA polymerase sigma-70 factor (ECF subfamily)